MPLELWQAHVRTMAHQIVDGDTEALRLLSAMLHEADETKELLRRHGFGWTGLGLRETAQLVLEEVRA